MPDAAMTRCRYWLQVVYKSNDRPWRNDHYELGAPWHPLTRDDAVLSAAYMQDNMPDYQITLFEDGKVVEYAQAQQEAEARFAQSGEAAGDTQTT